LNDRVRGTVILCGLSVGLSACATSYQTRGLVLRVDATSSTMTVSHDAIAGYMDAMVMPFAVRDPRELNRLRPGDVVGFRLRPRPDGTVIDRIKHLSAAASDSGLTMTPSIASLVRIGGSVPDFSLVDQDGRTVTLAGLRGSVIAVTFIYSRCPLPDYCPLVVANLAQVRDRYRDRLGRDLVLLTVSFDPKYDTPEVLRTYAARYGGNIPGWHFLTGSPYAIAAVCASFGIEYWPDQGLITHTLQTAVVDRQGRLAASVEGRGFSARQIADLVGSVLDR
jgi:protein SCO1/2